MEDLSLLGNESAASVHSSAAYVNDEGCINTTSEFDFKNYPVIFIYVPIGIIACVANLLVITVVVKFQYMRNVTNYFLVNLSVADLLVTIVCMPNGALAAYTQLWWFDDVTCKLTNFMQCISVASSVFTITAMALDRYLAITQPFSFGRFSTRKSTVFIIGLMWVTSILIFSPVLIVTQMDVPMVFCDGQLVKFCSEIWLDNSMRSVFGIVSFCVMFAIPGLVILWAYSMMGRKLCSGRPPTDDNNSISNQQSSRLIKERKRVAWILLMLVLIFACCWLPYNTIKLLQDNDLITNKNNLSEYLQYTLLLGHLNSALNPIIYCAMSRNFRDSLKDLLCRTQINFNTPRNRRLQVQWADSSASSQRLCLHRINTGPPAHAPLHTALSRLQSSQKTKTCTV